MEVNLSQYVIHFTFQSHAPKALKENLSEILARDMFYIDRVNQVEQLLSETSLNING